MIFYVPTRNISPISHSRDLRRKRRWTWFVFRFILKHVIYWFLIFSGRLSPNLLFSIANRFAVTNYLVWLMGICITLVWWLFFYPSGGQQAMSTWLPTPGIANIPNITCWNFIKLFIFNNIYIRACAVGLIIILK